MMIDSKIVEILNKHNTEVAEEISNINLAIKKIKNELKLVSDCLIGELLSYSKNTGIKNKENEIELLNESICIREYIDTIDILEFNNYQTEENTSQKENIELAFCDVIVLNNTLNCDLKHKTHDINIIVPTLGKIGNIINVNVLASYCEDCNRYTITKDSFNQINGVILCEVIDKTITTSKNNNDDIMIELEQHESILYRYGYNVKSKNSLTSKQRHIIIASLVEAGVLTRSQIVDHLTMLINRGEKIESWKDATEKWKQDRYFTLKYKKENLPSVIANKILLKYNEQKD